MGELNAATKGQIVEIQCLDILRYVCKVIKTGDIREETIKKVQKLFDVLHDR